MRQIAGQVDHLLSAGGVHAVSRFVENQKFRIMHDGGGELKPLFHAGRIRFDRPIARFVEPDVIDRSALDYLHAKGMRSLVLDLRDNPGGFLDQAIKVAEAFTRKITCKQ